MKLSIDACDNLTGWNINSPSTIALNQHASHIAGLNTNSLMIKFDESDSVKTLTKSYSSINVSEYKVLIFSVWSRRLGNSKTPYRKADDFYYKIKINSSAEYYISVWETFENIEIGIDDIDILDRIEITALHTETDWLVLSEIVIEKEDLPLDMLNAAKENIEYFLKDQGYENGILIESGLTLYQNDTSIIFSSIPNWLMRNSVIKIIEGSTSEIHRIDNNNETEFEFSAAYDGTVILNNYTSADVYLYLPVEINPDENDVNLPGISLWGVEPEAFLRISKNEEFIDTFSLNNTFQSRYAGEYNNYIISVNIEGYQSELIQFLAKIIRIFLGREIIWCNGRKHDVWFSGSPVEIKPAQGVDIIPKITYNMIVEYIENVFDRSTVQRVQTTNISSTPEIFSDKTF